MQKRDWWYNRQRLADMSINDLMTTAAMRWQMYTVEAGEQIPASASVVAEAGDLNVDAYINAQNRVWRTIDTSRIKVPKCPW